MKWKSIIVLLLLGACCFSAEPISDPLKAMAQPGTILLTWKVDINHDGTNDVLVGYKPTPEEAEEAKESLGVRYVPSQIGFAVFIHLSNNRYIKSEYTEIAGGQKGSGFIAVDVEQCYVGYIEEVKAYGIVTAEISEQAPPSGRGRGVRMRQVYCYTVDGDHIKRTNLTDLFGIWESNPKYEKYLSESKRTNVALREIPPLHSR